MSDYIYLDYAATAPLCEESAAALAPFMQCGPAHVLAGGGNANSLHTPGRTAFELMEQARKSVAESLGAKRPAEIIFTSGATEADNAALFGLTRAALQKRANKGNHSSGHVIVSSIEHDAVLEPARRLKREGIDVTFLPVDSRGLVSTDALKEALREDTVLVSVMLANSEVGSIQPIKQLAHLAHESGALFHTDATQALGKIPVNMQNLGVDAASFSGHKIGAPKGVGVLYVAARVPFHAYMLGGGQEEGRRSGTQNVPNICAFAAACRAAVEMQPAEAVRLQAFRDELYTRLGEMKRVTPTIDADARAGAYGGAYLPNIVHVLVSGYESETLIILLDEMGFGVSGGSACSSHSLEPSHVLKAMGISADKAYGALRLSLGRYTTREHIDAFLEAFAHCIHDSKKA